MDNPLFQFREEYRPFEYPQAALFAEKQRAVYWSPEKIKVGLDVLNFETDFTAAEQHGILTTLKLFTKYEVFIGDYWIDIVYRHFPKHEIRQMASMFSALELTAHAPFYDKLNDALGLSTKQFHLAYKSDPHLHQRVQFLQKQLDSGVKKVTPYHIALIAMMEGVVLFSSFAFLMSFYSNGGNRLSNIFTGLSYSWYDENLHALGGAWLFQEMIKGENPSKYEKKILEQLDILIENEYEIIDNTFARGPIKGITAHQLKQFVNHRANFMLRSLGYEDQYDEDYNPIKAWFYNDSKALELTDFFHNDPSAYTIDWDFSSVTYGDINV